MKKFIQSIFILFILTPSLFAYCFKVGNMRGVTGMKKDSYRIESDKLVNQVIIVNADKENASVTGWPNRSCLAWNNLSVVCVADNGNGATVETWLINGDKVQYTKSISGYGKFDGVKLMIGDVLGECEK